MATIQDLRNELERIKTTPQGVAHDLRLNLADVIIQQLASKDWTQAKLAEAAGLKPPYLTRVMHSSQNWTTEVAGKILCALGIKLDFVVVPLTQTQEKDLGSETPSSQGIKHEKRPNQEVIFFQPEHQVEYSLKLCNQTKRSKAAELYTFPRQSKPACAVG